MREPLESAWGALQIACHLALGPFLRCRPTRGGSVEMKAMTAHYCH